MSRCQEVYVRGPRQGRPCPYRATTIIAMTDFAHYACGYHSRAYVRSVIYPLDWHLGRIRAFQRDNLELLLKR